MMTVNDYIRDKFRTYGVVLSDADLLEASLNSGISGNDCVSKDNIDKVTISMAHIVPSLLLRATSVDENGFSMSWNVSGIKEYYNFLCNKYGLKNELSVNDNPKVNFIQ